jgi:hypothetical protein
MDTNKPRTTEVTQAELELLEACRRNPYLAGNITYLLDRYQAETNTSMDANQAEMSIVEIVRAMGSRLLTQWGEETHAEIAAMHFSNPGLIGNGKKNSAGTAPSGASQSTSKSSARKPTEKPTAPSSRKQK